MVVTYWKGTKLKAEVILRAVSMLQKAGDILVEDITMHWTATEGIGVPSPPGTPPAVQSSTLERSIRHEIALIEGNEIQLRVGAGREAPYGIEHEFGVPGKLLARPWLIPAFERVLPTITALFAGGI